MSIRARVVWAVVRMTAVVLLAACASYAPPALTIEQRAILSRQLGRIHDTIPIVRFRPPRYYDQLKRAVEDCSGIRKEGWPVFYLAPINPLDARGHLGMFLPAVLTDTMPPKARDRAIAFPDRILFALGAEADEIVVMHEILHWLLDPHHRVNWHPAEYFGDENAPGRCGAYVTIRQPERP